MTKLVIGVGGLLTAGKDVFADRLVEKHGFTKLGMSDVLADCLYALNPIVERGWDTSDYPIKRYQQLVDEVGYVEAKKNPEVRRLLQALGTEVGRQILGENIWVDTVKKRIFDVDGDVVITGIRFENELTMISQLGWASTFNAPAVNGTTVWVRRAGLEAPAGTHASENTLSNKDFEYILENSSTLEALEVRSDELVEEIRADFVSSEEQLREDLLTRLQKPAGS